MKCWNCNKSDLVVTPDPGMQGATDRIICRSCGETQDIGTMTDAEVDEIPDCRPDCDERASCDKAGEAAHQYCGRCVHGEPVHHGCSKCTAEAARVDSQTLRLRATHGYQFRESQYLALSKVQAYLGSGDPERLDGTRYRVIRDGLYNQGER